MFYSLLKLYARLAIKIYCRRVVINKPGVINSKGPLLLACNHPNSFLDGMIITTLFDQPVYSLARGDVFKKKRINRFLRSLQLLPVYRTSEGVENLGHNYTTFDACRKTFDEKGIVLIFSEGRCENEWHLRPLRKGTARLAITSWMQNIPLTVLPTGINYSSFGPFGKEVHLNFGEPVKAEEVMSQFSEGKRLLNFNEQLNEQLHHCVYEIDANDKEKIHRLFSIKKQPSFYFLLLPAAAGWLACAPLYYLCKLISKRFKHTGHYDSVLHSLLLVTYPFYLLLVCCLLFFVNPVYALISFICLPLLAWCTVRAKYQAGW